ncbi:MAG TPA: TetR/AcrR family transcriptional regulator [Acidimicrobiales bacterium]|nr:TetR/AcrR family transcriptional regulator [Acidimicrobiales bacterium]
MTTGTVLETGPRPGNQAASEHPARGRRRDDSREQAILDAAVELIVTAGYDAMSIEAVAAHAGVSKATIYRRWTGKAELVADAMRRMGDGAHADPEDTGSLRGDLLAMSRTLFTGLAGADGGLVCGLAVAVRADPELGRLLADHKRAYRQRVTSLIVSRAQDRGELPTGTEPPELVEIAAGVSLLRIMSGEPLDDPFADYLVDRVLIPSLRS